MPPHSVFSLAKGRVTTAARPCFYTTSPPPCTSIYFLLRRSRLFLMTSESQTQPLQALHLYTIKVPRMWMGGRESQIEAFSSINCVSTMDWLSCINFASASLIFAATAHDRTTACPLYYTNVNRPSCFEIHVSLQIVCLANQPICCVTGPFFAAKWI